MNFYIRKKLIQRRNLFTQILINGFIQKVAENEKKNYYKCHQIYLSTYFFLKHRKPITPNKMHPTALISEHPHIYNILPRLIMTECKALRLGRTPVAWRHRDLATLEVFMFLYSKWLNTLDIILYRSSFMKVPVCVTGAGEGLTGVGKGGWPTPARFCSWLGILPDLFDGFGKILRFLCMVLIDFV